MWLNDWDSRWFAFRCNFILICMANSLIYSIIPPGTRIESICVTPKIFRVESLPNSCHIATRSYMFTQARRQLESNKCQWYIFLRCWVLGSHLNPVGRSLVSFLNTLVWYVKIFGASSVWGLHRFHPRPGIVNCTIQPGVYWNHCVLGFLYRRFDLRIQLILMTNLLTISCWFLVSLT